MPSDLNKVHMIKVVCKDVTNIYFNQTYLIMIQMCENNCLIWMKKKLLETTIRKYKRK